MGDHVRSPNTDFYGILGISKTATICKAYKSLVTKWNPDKNHSDKAEAEVRFQEINDADKAINHDKIEEKNTSEGSLQHKSNDETFFSRPAVLLRSLSKMNNRSPGSNPSGSNHGNTNGSYHGNINSPQPDTSQSKTNTIKGTVTLEELFDSSPSSSKSTTRRPSETKERSRSKSTTRRDPSESTGVSGRSKSTTRRDPSESTGVSGRSKSTTRRDPSEGVSGRSKSTTRRDPSESTSVSGRSKSTTRRDPSESTSVSGRSKSTTRRDPSESVSGSSKSTTRRDTSDSSDVSGRSKNTTRRSASDTDFPNMSGSVGRRSSSTSNIVYSQSTARRKPAPIETKLECTLEELCFGCVKHIQIKRDIIRQGIIEKEEERVKIKIQAGWKKGTKITFEGKGDEKPGYYPADIIFSIEETPHPLFQRIADDLEYGVEIPLVNALTGCSISIPLLGGEKMSLKFDDIIYPGYEKIILGQGMPLSKDDQERRGNLRIQFLVKFPVELSDEQRSLAIRILQDCS